MGERLSLMPAVAKLRPQLCWELKTKIKPLVKVMYGFKTGQNKKTNLYNQKLTEDLKEGSAFAFKACDQGQDGYLCLQVATDLGMEFGSFEDKPTEMSTENCKGLIGCSRIPRISPRILSHKITSRGGE
ncbi:hypothetical protein B0H10DRAFT_2188691 [Mycena sp. CBHHK59/15]|nr:hypothetical protein B0H10DRAFT_2188691 [Mycena sp. CBHHK59/15]